MRFLARTSPAVVTLMSSALVLGGCSVFSTMDQCDDLRRTVNPVLKEIARDHARAGDSPEHLRGAAAQYDGLAERLSAKDYGAPLGRTVTVFADLFRSTAENLEEGASALEGKNAKKMKGVRQAAQQHVTRQRQLVRRLDDACGVD